MKTEQSYTEKLPSPGRFIFFLLVISILCFFSCITTTSAHKKSSTERVDTTN